jgi:hypothetical protein
VAFSRSRLKTSSAAPLTLHFLVTLFEKTFAFAILAFHFPFACVLLHALSKSNTDAYNLAKGNAIRQIACSRLANFRFRAVRGLRSDATACRRSAESGHECQHSELSWVASILIQMTQMIGGRSRVIA